MDSQLVPYGGGGGNKPSSDDASTIKREEKRVIERNRRNHMKDLYSNLNSLLPNYNNNPREVLSLPDQVEKAIDYIKRLERNVKMANEKKQGLLLLLSSSKRSGSSSTSAKALKAPAPNIQIHELGSLLEVIVTCGIHNQFIFNDIIRLLHEEEHIEVTSANSSFTAGDSMLFVVHAQITLPSYQFGASKVSDRLKRLVNGSASNVEIDLSDFEMDDEIMWELHHIFQQ